MWDMAAMEQQCDFGLQALQRGRIEHMVFGASWLCDRHLPAVEWTREWIRKVGNQKLVV